MELESLGVVTFSEVIEQRDIQSSIDKAGVEKKLP